MSLRSGGFRTGRILPHVPTICRCYRLWEGANSEPRIWACVEAGLVSVPALPYLHHQVKLSISDLVRPPTATISRVQGQLSWERHWFIRQTSSMVMPSQGATGWGWALSLCCNPRGARPSLLLSLPQGWLKVAFAIKARPTMLPRQGGPVNS